MKKIMFLFAICGAFFLLSSNANAQKPTATMQTQINKTKLSKAAPNAENRQITPKYSSERKVVLGQQNGQLKAKNADTQLLKGSTSKVVQQKNTNVLTLDQQVKIKNGQAQSLKAANSKGTVQTEQKKIKTTPTLSQKVKIKSGKIQSLKAAQK